MEKESVYGVREVLTWFSGAFSGGAADMGSGAIGFGRPWAPLKNVGRETRKLIQDMVHVLQAQTSRPLAPLSLQHLPHLDPLALISINQLLSQIRLKSSLIPLKLQTPQLQSLAKTRMVVWF